jgi:hypothetical protein
MCAGAKGIEAISRRSFLQRSSLAAAAVAGIGMRSRLALGVEPISSAPLEEFGYGDVSMASEAHEAQLMNTHDVLMALSEDSLLKPFRQMSGMPAPGEDLGGWYELRSQLRPPQGTSMRASLPDATLGNGCQRWRASTPLPAKRPRAKRCCASIASMPRPSRRITTSRIASPPTPTTSWCSGFSTRTLYRQRPAGAGDSRADHQHRLPHLPGHAIEHDHPWRTDKDPSDASWTWDESYTMPENLFLAYQRGAGKRYYDLGLQYLERQALVRSALAQ